VKKLPIALLFAGLVVLRVAIVLSWHQPVGDGMQYYRIAEQLRIADRFAFAPDPAPLVYSRLPGYPLFLAYVAAPIRGGVSLETHLIVATLWNVVFDLGTALFVFLTARALGLGRAWLTAIAILCWPTLWLMSCHALTESLSTLAVAAQLFLAVTILRGGRLRHAAIAGAIAGFAQLVRLDALTVMPMVLYACWRASPAREIRLRLSAAYLLCAAVVFAPWPIRNYLRFGAPHFTATTWRGVEGAPLPDGPMEWMRTWADSTDGDAYLELMFSNRHPIEQGLLPKQWDDEAEHQRLLAIVDDYNHYGPIEKVDAGFAALAKERFRRHPWRTLFVLPAKRLTHLFRGEPSFFMGMEIPWLGLPAWRPAFGVIDAVVFVLALAGCILGRRSQWMPLLLAPFPLRFLVYAYAIPFGTSERYFVETFPILLILAWIGVSELVRAR
jgi:Dolichyl-phosphate-mannose-protein mannosyltransferase